METEQTLETRRQLRTALSKLVESVGEIERIMKDLPKKRGMVHRSLKPQDEEYIVSGLNGFNSTYKDENGTLYDISIHKREEGK